VDFADSPKRPGRSGTSRVEEESRGNAIRKAQSIRKVTAQTVIWYHERMRKD
jgi:hypothetical protein